MKIRRLTSVVVRGYRILAGSLVTPSTLRSSAHFIRQESNSISTKPPWRGARCLHLPTPSNSQRQTIYALATPPGRGGVAVIRVSGPQAAEVYMRLVRTNSNVHKMLPPPQKMQRCTVVNPFSHEEIDDGLAVFFKGPRSFTTEDVLELHVHSGRAIILSILNALSQLAQPNSPSNMEPIFMRHAEAGEFTRRAFEGGRIDLTQAEATNDLVNAQTEIQRRIARNAVKGKTRSTLERFRSKILRATALIEALIDFGEDQQLDESEQVLETARKIVEDLQIVIQKHLDESWRGEILRSGVHLPIYGPPNVGKSSLFNMLVGREAAIVTHIPGTTRDVMEVSVDIGGMMMVVADTAGLHETEDLVEQIGIQRARQRVSEAPFSLCVLSLPDIVDSDGQTVQIPDDVRELHVPDRTFYLLNKCDLAEPRVSESVRHSFMESLAMKDGVWVTSIQSGQCTDAFLSEFSTLLHKSLTSLTVENDPLITNARHREHLQSAVRFMAAFQATDDIVIAAEELRYAANSIGKVTGKIGVEEVLEVIFREFCIGK